MTNKYPILYPVNNTPTPDKIENYNYNSNIFYRFQDPTLEIGTQSWGMIYTSAEEAIEDGSTVLEGKSCFGTAKELRFYNGTIDPEAVILVFSGWDAGTGHDGETLADIDQILEIWNMQEFKNTVNKMLEDAE
ncbi:MAG TPA: hypothetical protein DEP72_06380 [Clostridiales bacterium]|nr:hypothetical protein [Clostridiales bacterium]